MANKTKANKRRRNPLYRTQGLRPPKLRFDGHKVHTVLFSNQSAIADIDDGVGSDWQEIGTNASEGAARPAFEIIRHYQEYKYLSCQCEWIPRIGPSATDSGGRISIAYIDNPEQMNVFQNLASQALKVAYVRTLGNCKTFNMWERFTFRVPLTHRRKVFNVNTTWPAIGSRTAEEFDRATQGLVIVAYEAITITAITAGALGQWRITADMALSGFLSTSVS